MNQISTSNPWVIGLRKPQAKFRLFCFPYAGGSATIYRQWVQNPSENLEVYAVELPGRGRQIKSPPFSQLQPLVGAIATALLPYLDIPFAFFGHSMGGLLSFELTRLLCSQYHLTPLHLFISARRAPQIPSTARQIHNLPEADFLEEIGSFNGTPKQVLENQELMQMFLPILRADFSVLENYTYTPEPPLDCPISIFGGWQDQGLNYASLEAWQEQTTKSFSLDMFEGDHFFLHSFQEILIQKIVEKL